MKTHKPTLCTTTEEISQMLIGGVEELIGRDDLQELLKREDIPFELDLNQAIRLTGGLSFAEIKRMEGCLEDRFGENGSRGAALHTGRSFFQDLTR